MNTRHAREFLTAAAACDPAGPAAELQELLSSAPPDAEWEGGATGAGGLSLRPRERAATPGGKRFSAASFDEPVASALKTFDALAPIASVRLEDRGRRWSLRLATPLPWPLFLRCDVAASFAPRADSLSLLLRDARVTALEFDGEALWARFVG